MPELTFTTAFLAGLLGSGHCLGMCGGLATALGTADPGPRRAWHALLCQLGRLTSYGAAGALVGGAGAAVGFAFSISTWGALLRLAAAAMIVLIGLDIVWGASGRGRWLRVPERWGARVWRRLAPGARRLLPAAPGARAVVFGLLWGWLPCGLVYSVLLAAAVSGGPAQGSATMIAFGLGTLPAMTGLGFFGTRLPQRDGTATRLVGAALVACGLWMAVTPLAIVRGSHEHEREHAHTLLRNIRSDAGP